MQQQVVQEVAREIEAMGEEAELPDLVNLVMQYAGDDDRLQALVGLVRPALDYNFFQELTLRIGQAPAEEREKLEALRADLTELTALVDQQQQMMVQNAVRLLQAIINSPNPEEILMANLSLVDDTFMAVLTANIQEAERRGDVNSSARLKQVYQIVVQVLQENMQPELRFVNDLLATESDESARQMIAERAKDFGGELLDIMDAVGQMLAEQGETEMIQKLAYLREAAAHELS